MIQIRPLFLVLLMSVAGATAPAGAAVTSRTEIDAKAREAVQTLYKESSAAKELAGHARGMLVFPAVYKGGIGIGAEYGEGALMVGGGVIDYYNIASGSIGFQLGAQRKSVVVMFMTDEAFQKFRGSEGWKAGVDGSVAIATLGVGGALDTETVKKPIIGFVFSNKGLMYNLTLEGSKISKIHPKN
jgi:lipid-binding SYLF domain-containing protein